MLSHWVWYVSHIYIYGSNIMSISFIEGSFHSTILSTVAPTPVLPLPPSSNNRPSSVRVIKSTADNISTYMSERSE